MLINIFLIFHLLFSSQNICYGQKTNKIKNICKTCKDNNIKSEKWVVITTISPPTDQINNLYHILPDEWKIVIIGDKKSIPELWNVYDNSTKLIFLSIEDQLKLKYETLKYIPYNTYCRKTIGYLYAIEHGAKEIYETDDDNELTNINFLNFNFSDYDLIPFVNIGNNKMINPYAYFGQKTVWPRGFRLNDIGKKYINNTYNMTYIQNINLKPLIHIGLVNGDPDVDAIFRLTRSLSMKEIDIKFDDNKRPLLYFPNNYVPINTQNTRIDYKIFPSLPLPVSLTMRETDIWRGYIIQKFAWLYNGMTVFHPPNAYQKRNPHDYMIDYKEEYSLYNKLDLLLNTLDEKVNENLNISEYFLNIIENLIKNKILTNNDLLLYKAYLSDLQTFNYQFNENFNRKNNYDNIFNLNSIFFLYYIPGSYNDLVLNNDNTLEIVNKYKSKKYYEDILLMINYNIGEWVTNTEYLLDLYKNYFKHIVFITELIDVNKTGYFSCPESPKGLYSYICIKKVYEKYPNMKGYLFVMDDILFKPWELENLDFNLIWTTNLFRKRDIPYDWYWWEEHSKKLDIVFKQNKEFKEYINQIMKANGYFCGLADYYYIPNRLINDTFKIFDIMFNEKVFMELAVPTTFILLKEKNYVFQDILILWDEKREKILYYINNYHNFISYHPVKFSNKIVREEIKNIFSLLGPNLNSKKNLIIDTDFSIMQKRKIKREL